MVDSGLLWLSKRVLVALSHRYFGGTGIRAHQAKMVPKAPSPQNQISQHVNHPVGVYVRGSRKAAAQLLSLQGHQETWTRLQDPSVRHQLLGQLLEMQSGRRPGLCLDAQIDLKMMEEK